MAFNFEQWLRAGGTQVAKTPEEAQEVFRKTEIGKAISRSGRKRRRVSGGGGVTVVPSPTPAPPPTIPIPEPTPEPVPEPEPERTSFEKVIQPTPTEKFDVKEFLERGGTQVALLEGVKEPKPTISSELTVEEAPGLVEQYRSFLEDRPKISGTLEFAGEKVSGFLSSQYDLFGGRQESVGKLGKVSTQVAPFFVPVLGPGLALGIGAETIFTRTGREEVKLTSQQLEEEYGVPKTIGTIGQYGVAGGLVFLGGKGLLTDVERVLGLPKTTTRIIGAQRVSGKKAVTDVVFETRTKKLLGTTTDIGAARISTDILKSGELIGGRSVTFGGFGQKGVTFPARKVKLGRVRQFSVSEWSLTQPSKVTESFKEGIFKVSREVEGFKTISGGRVVVGKALFDKPFKISKVQFLGGGGGFNIGKTSKFFGRTRVVKEGELLQIGDVGKSLERRGKGFFEGLIVRKKTTTKAFDIMGGKGLDTALTQQAMRGAMTGDVAVALSRTFKSIKPIAPPISRRVKTQITQAPVQEEVRLTSGLGELVSPKTTDLQKEFNRLSFNLGSGLGTTQRRKGAIGTQVAQKEMLGIGLIQTPLIKQREKQDVVGKQIFRGVQKQKQKTKLIPRSPPISFALPPFTPFGFPPLLPPILPPTLESGLKKIPKRKRPFRRIPSFAAVQLDIFAPEPVLGEFTGLVERPRIKKKKKRKKK